LGDDPSMGTTLLLAYGAWVLLLPPALSVFAPSAWRTAALLLLLLAPLCLIGGLWAGLALTAFAAAFLLFRRSRRRRQAFTYLPNEDQRKVEP